MRDRLGVHLLAVDGEHAGSTFAEPGPVIFKIENDCVLARRERRTFPTKTRHVEQVVSENRFSLQQIKAVAAETSTQSDQHSLSTALRYFHFGGYGVRLVQNAGGITDGWPGYLARVIEYGSPGGRARTRRDNARQ